MFCGVAKLTLTLPSVLLASAPLCSSGRNAKVAKWHTSKYSKVLRTNIPFSGSYGTGLAFVLSNNRQAILNASCSCASVKSAAPVTGLVNWGRASRNSFGSNTTIAISAPCAHARAYTAALSYSLVAVSAATSTGSSPCRNSARSSAISTASALRSAANISPFLMTSICP